jgi:hypothetical protein
MVMPSSFVTILLVFVISHLDKIERYSEKDKTAGLFRTRHLHVGREGLRVKGATSTLDGLNVQGRDAKCSVQGWNDIYGREVENLMLFDGKSSWFLSVRGRPRQFAAASQQLAESESLQLP